MARGRHFAPASRRTAWSGVAARMEFQGLGSAETLGSVNVGAAANAAGLTHLRIRGHLGVRFVAGAASDSMLVGIGIGFADAEAFAAGSASLPGPITDIDENWLWHALIPLGPAVGAEAQTDNGMHWQIEIDSKAKRRLDIDDTLYLKAEGLITAGTPTADGFAAFRHLVMLP